MTQARFTVMGTGASSGVPVIGCQCAICTGGHPKNQRLRTSCLLEVEGKKLLVDVGPDFREQALKHKIDRLDGLILTHHHYDHIAGIDELRIYNFRQKMALPCLLSSETLQSMQINYNYIFEQGPGNPVNIACEVFDESLGVGSFQGVPLSFTSYHQVGMKVMGLRFGDLAFISDIKNFDWDHVVNTFKGVRTAIIGAIRREGASGAHLLFDEAIALGQALDAEQIYLTHLCHEVDHEQESKRLPKGVALAYDGLQLNLTLE